MKFTLGFNVEEKSGVVEISEMSIKYSQPADSNSSRDDYQFLTVTAQNCGTGEDDWYYDISTDTHWSVNEPQEIADIVQDFISRMELNITKEKDL